MSIDKALRELIRDEVSAQIRPLAAAISRLQGSGLGLDALRTLLAGGRARRASAREPSGDRGCALRGCKRQARSKGYCAAHYQKFRNLSKTNRLPPDWVEHAPPGSVEDLVLPRGRAAAKLLRQGQAGGK